MTDWNKRKTHLKQDERVRKDLIHSKIDPVPNSEKAGVYIIRFNTEDQKSLFYIGMTSRKFKERLKEHLSDIKFDKPSTALSRLHQKENIKIDFGKAKTIIPTSNHYSSIIRESIEILLRNDTVCNDVLLYNIPAIWFNILGISRDLII